MMRFQRFIFLMLACITARGSLPAHAEWVLDSYDFDRYGAFEHQNTDSQGKYTHEVSGYQTLTGEAFDTTSPKTIHKHQAAIEDGAPATISVATFVHCINNGGTISGGKADFNLTITPIFKWIGTGEPYKEITYVENCRLYTERSDFTENNAPSSLFDVNLTDPWHQTWDNYAQAGPNTLSSGSTVRHITKIKTTGTETRGKSRSFSGKVTGHTMGAEGVSRGEVQAGYSAEMANLSISVTPLGPYALTKNEPQDKATDGITRWKARMQYNGVFDNQGEAGIDAATFAKYQIDPFMSAQSDFSVTAKTASGTDLFSGQKYVWDIKKQPYLPTIPPPAAEDLPIVIYSKAVINGMDTLNKIGEKLNPGAFSEMTSMSANLPEFWPDILKTMDMSQHAADIPDTWKPGPSTSEKTLTWDFGNVSSPPSTTVKVKVTGTDAESPVTIGKVKLNWKKPKNRLYEVTIFPAEWQLEPNNTDLQNYCYTYFSNDELVQKQDMWLDTQILTIAAGEALGAAAKGARVFFTELKAGSSAFKLATETAEHSAPIAETSTGEASRATSGNLRTRARAVDEAHNPLQGADADEATVSRPLKPNNCFVAGTPVEMADGTFKAIELVQAGDIVASKEIGTGRRSAKKVLRTFRNIAPVLLTLTLGNGEMITTTPGHPFATSEHGDFVLAGQLPMGVNLVADFGDKAQIQSESTQKGAFPIFNFEVEDFHTYFVGKSQVWVHNDSYVNLNPAATPDEITIGRYLDEKAQANNLPGVKRVSGAAEVPGARSGDYRFTLADDSVVPGDLYQPQSGNPNSIASAVFKKSGQADIVVVELGAGSSGQISIEDAQNIAGDVVSTPGLTINRVIIMKDGQVIADASRVPEQ